MSIEPSVIQNKLIMVFNINHKELKEKLSHFLPEQKARYFELVAHWITIEIRVICSKGESDPSLSLKEVKFLNEVQHRILQKIKAERSNSGEWDDDMLFDLMKDYIELCPSIKGNLSTALTRSYDVHTNNV